LAEAPPRVELSFGAERIGSSVTVLDARGELRAEVLPFLDYLAERIAEQILAEPSVSRLATRTKPK
jgi:hypothetical protein